MMRPARLILMVTSVAAVALSAQQPKPAKPMQIEKIKDGLWLVRGDEGAGLAIGAFV
jgi:hypothetical protein